MFASNPWYSLACRNIPAFFLCISVSSHGILLALYVFLCISSPLIRTSINHLGLRAYPTVGPHLNIQLNDICKNLISQWGHILRYKELGSQHTFWEPLLYPHLFSQFILKLSNCLNFLWLYSNIFCFLLSFIFCVGSHSNELSLYNWLQL